MPVCSYLVIPAPGRSASVAGDLAAIPGCEVTRAENRDLLILVTDTESPDEEETLRDAVHGTDGIQALLLTFGELDPDAVPARPTPHATDR
jgi:nitrate reductase NapAB chaperone NapD